MTGRPMPIWALATLSMLAACGPSTAEPATTRSPTANPTPAPASILVVDLNERPLVLFGPLPKDLDRGGSLDYMELFAESAGWQAAAGQVHVFKLYGGWVADFPWHTYATDQELRQIIDDLNRRGIALGFEAGPLVPTDECGRGIEGFFGPEEGLRIVDRLKSLGAEVRFVMLDEPFAFAQLYDGPQACHWPSEKIAQQVQDYMRAIHSVYPEAIIGDIEPLWAGVRAEQLVGWLDAYQAVAGSPLPFIHLDLDFSVPDWPAQAKQLEDAARARGVEFGIFYLGDEGAESDAEWVGAAEERAYRYEALAGGRPDHVIFQSWHDRPDRALPETDPNTFTGLIYRYFRPRVVLSLDLGPVAEEGSRPLSGELSDATGLPLDGETVELTVRALDGPGFVSAYSISGSVPIGAVRSDVGFRVNTECGCQGAADFILYEARYTEAEGTSSSVPNGGFSAGMDGWGAWGAGTIRLEPSDRAGGRMLHVIANPGQDAAINSALFPVTPGAKYQLTFLARVPPGSAGSGYFDITFQDAGAEFKRETLPLESPGVPIGSTTTDAEGRYSLVVEFSSQGQMLLEARFPGTDEYWPAYAKIVFSTE